METGSRREGLNFNPMDTLKTDILIGYGSAARLYMTAGPFSAELQTQLLHRRLGKANATVCASEARPGSARQTLERPDSAICGGPNPSTCRIPDFAIRGLTIAAIMETLFDRHRELRKVAPVEILVGHPSARLRNPMVNCHAWTAPIPDGGVIGIEDGLYVSSPEFTYLQMAWGAPVVRLAMLGSELCGSFLIDGKALPKRKPVTSIEEISSFLSAVEASLSEHPWIAPPAVARARNALRYVVGEGRSPFEIACALMLGMPTRLGGFGLGMPVLNPALDVTVRRDGIRKTVKIHPDMLWAGRKLAVEYDSDEHHMSGRQRGRDSDRAILLRDNGYTVVQITTSQLCSYRLLENVVRHIMGTSFGKRRLTRFEADAMRFKPRREKLLGELIDIARNGCR